MQKSIPNLDWFDDIHPALRRNDPSLPLSTPFSDGHPAGKISAYEPYYLGWIIPKDELRKTLQSLHWDEPGQLDSIQRLSGSGVGFQDSKIDSMLGIQWDSANTNKFVTVPRVWQEISWPAPRYTNYIDTFPTMSRRPKDWVEGEEGRISYVKVLAKLLQRDDEPRWYLPQMLEVLWHQEEMEKEGDGERGGE